MKKKLLMLVFIAILTITMTACGGNEVTTEATTNGSSVVDKTEEPTVESTTRSDNFEEITDKTEEPTTEKPTTEEPTTEAPTTEEPTTEEPTTTIAEPMTEAPTTEEPEATTEPTTESVETVSEFGTMLKELHTFTTYEERKAYIENLDKTKYKVEEVDNFDLITQVNGAYIDFIDTYDIETGEYIGNIAPNSRVHYPSFNKDVLSACIGIYMSDTEIITGETYLMTITDLSTGETDPWGVKIYKAGSKTIEEENEFGWTSYTYVVDPESAVTVVPCTIEDLIYVKNGNEVWEDPNHVRITTVISPVSPEEKYDDNWQPTGEYFIYEISEETIYVESEAVKCDEWGNYYCYDENGWYQSLGQDDNGAYYYILENRYEVPIEDLGYTVAHNENSGTYLVDKDGNVVTKSSEMGIEVADQDIDTWDTLKYYDDVYHPIFMRDFVDVVGWDGIYAIADMKAEDYPYLDATDFESLMKRYMELFDITIDEEVLAIKASIPEEWGWQYEDYYDKAGELFITQPDEAGNYNNYTLVIDRKENWFFHNIGQCELAVKDDNISKSGPAHEVMYNTIYKQEYNGEAEPTKDVINLLLSEYAREKKVEDIVSITVNGKQVFYVETNCWDELRVFYILQDIGLEDFVSIDIETYDMETEAGEFIKQFLLDDNYTLRPWEDEWAEE